MLKKIDLETTPLTLEKLLAELNSKTDILLTRGNDLVAYVAAPEINHPSPKHDLAPNKNKAWIRDYFASDKQSMSFWLGDYD